jgi:hypothetical protein
MNGCKRRREDGYRFGYQERTHAFVLEFVIQVICDSCLLEHPRLNRFPKVELLLCRDVQHALAPLTAKAVRMASSPSLGSLSPCRRLSTCTISSPKKRQRSGGSVAKHDLFAAAANGPFDAHPIDFESAPQSPFLLASATPVQRVTEAEWSPPFTGLSSVSHTMPTPGSSLNLSGTSSAESDDETAFSFPDLSPAPHPMSNAVLSDRASMDEVTEHREPLVSDRWHSG